LRSLLLLPFSCSPCHGSPDRCRRKTFWGELM
jgi:hypothetical protein